MSLSIYDIDLAIIEAAEALNSLVDEETGEVADIDIFEDLKAEIDGLQMKREKKISNVACWYKNLKAEAEAIKAEKQKLAKRQQAIENKAENLKKYLEYALQGEKFHDAVTSISYRKSKSVAFSENFDCRNLPEMFQKITYEPKKTEIKKAMEEDGIHFLGVEIVEKTSIQIK